MEQTKVDRKKVCWYCGGSDLTDLGDYARCNVCGATWNEVPKVGPEESGGSFIEQPNGEKGYTKYHGRRVAKRVTEQRLRSKQPC